jgi:hypothetical protein
LEWPLPLGEEGEKQEVDDPEKQPKSYKANNDKRKTRQVKIVKHTAGKGCSESK